MKPITSIKVTTKNGNSMNMRLGDLFTIDTELKVINSEITHHYTALILLTTAITQDLARPSHSRIYFTMVGADRMRHTIARATEDAVVLINPHGKESEIHKKHLIGAVRRFSAGETSIVAEGVRLYICTAISRLADLKCTNIHRMEARLMDLSKWPCAALVVWARNHLGIPSPNVPKAKYMDDRTTTINNMIKMSATRNANAPRLLKSDPLIVGDGQRPIIPPVGDDGQRLYEAFRSGAITRRCGDISGVKFLNLCSGEIATERTDEDRVAIYARSDVKMDSLDLYMVICIDNTPMWIIVPQEDDHNDIVLWRFYETGELLVCVRTFSKMNMHWLVSKLAEMKRRAIMGAPVRAPEGGLFDLDRGTGGYISGDVETVLNQPMLARDLHMKIAEPRKASIDTVEVESNVARWSDAQSNNAPPPDDNDPTLIWYGELGRTRSSSDSNEDEEV